MVDVLIVTETSQEANWNRQTGTQDPVLKQADALTKNQCFYFIHKESFYNFHFSKECYLAPWKDVRELENVWSNYFHITRNYI